MTQVDGAGFNQFWDQGNISLATLAIPLCIQVKNLTAVFRASWSYEEHLVEI